MLFFCILILYNKEVACFRGLTPLLVVGALSVRGHRALAMVVSCLRGALDRSRFWAGRWGVNFPSHKYGIHFSETLPF